MNDGLQVVAGRGELLSVGLGEVKIASRCGDVLIAYGLGSCVGVCMYDPAKRIAGMAHVVLPVSNGKVFEENPGKFADKAIPLLLMKMEGRGAHRSRLETKIVGGAKLVRLQGMEYRFDVGERNAKAVKECLAKHGLAIAAHDIGGTKGRTVHLFVDTGKIRVRVVGEGEREI